LEFHWRSIQLSQHRPARGFPAVFRGFCSCIIAFADEDGFARVVSNDEIREKGSNLSIPLYVRVDNGNGNGNGAIEAISLKQAVTDWQESSKALRESMSSLFEILEDAREMGGVK